MKRRSIFLFVCFLGLMLWPLFGWVLPGNYALQGVSVSETAPSVTAKGLWDGTFQTKLADYGAEKLPGRNFLIRTHNQLLYSLLKTSPNSNVVLATDGNLFEPGYLQCSLSIWPRMSEDSMQDLIARLTRLQQALEARGKQLYIFTTPSKARYVPSHTSLNLFYRFPEQGSASNEPRFIAAARETDLKVFDSVAAIDALRADFPYPIWYKSGIHWSNVLGNTVAADFAAWMSDQSGYDLTRLRVEAVPCEEAISPDRDLLETLNVFRSPREQYYQPVITVSHAGKDRPSVLFRGGSFMGQSLRMLAEQGIFGHFVHFENNYIFDNAYDLADPSTFQTLSSFSAYQEAENLPQLLDDSDILILEVNETMLDRMSFGFIDYLLEDYLPAREGAV